MTNGLGMDFGAGGWRVAVVEEGECFMLGDTVGVAAEAPEIRSCPRRTISLTATAVEVSRWLCLETAKWCLGSRKSVPGWKGGGKTIYEDVVQGQLRLLRANLESHLKAEILGAVIAVPSCYGMHQRGALRSLAEAAGFGNVGLIDESTAAVLSARQKNGDTRTVLVYAMGRSVFCASTLKVGAHSIEPLNHEGSVELGGCDLDAMLAQRIAVSILQKDNVKVSADRSVLRELIRQAERAKVALSSAAEAEVEVGPGRDMAGQPFHYRVMVRREDFDEIIRPLVAETIELSLKCVADAGLNLAEVDEVLMVGEAAHTPLVVKEVARVFGKRAGHAPKDAIARGAALYAAAEQNCFVRGTRSPDNKALGGEDRPARSAASASPSTALPSPEPTPEDPLLAALLGLRRLERHDFDAAIPAFESFLQQAQEELSFLYVKRAALLREDGKLDEAMPLWVRALQCCPGNDQARKALGAAHAHRACLFAKMGNLNRTKQELRASRKLDPHNREANLLHEELARVQRLPRKRRG